jgi:RimJ/RimL family protein N-acetyltransferase
MHGDAESNALNPFGPDSDVTASAERLSAWLEHWKAHGFGYWAVELSADGGAGTLPIIGFGGVRYDVWRGEPVLNLYYRIGRENWGRGNARDLARHAVEWSRQALAAVPLLARTVSGNLASQRTAMSVGLSRRPDLDDPAQPYGMVFADREARIPGRI